MGKRHENKKSEEIAVNAWILNQKQNWGIVRQEVLNILVSSRRPVCHIDALYPIIIFVKKEMIFAYTNNKNILLHVLFIQCDIGEVILCSTDTIWHETP